MDSNSSVLRQGLGGIGGLGKKLGKGVLEESKKTVKSAGRQIAGFESAQSDGQSKKANQLLEAPGKSRENQELIEAMYGKSEPPVKTPAAQVQEETATANPDKTPDEVQKIASLRMRLHQEGYYNPTFSPSKQEPEETPAERVEREEEEERWKLQEAEGKKPPPLAVSRERNKIESRVGSG
ncbi:hypothetical protein M1615_04090 [Patescibacteria group bacterium]|nr:hypothetical protein [Patescibacteria group bacterium]